MTRSLRLVVLTWSVLLTFLAFVGGCSSSSTPAAPALSSIDVSPAATSIAVGATVQFKATGKYADGSTNDITNDVSWSSSDVTIATVSDAAGTKGLATGVAKGSASILAKLGDISGTQALSVAAAPATLQSIAIAPTTPQLAIGTKFQLAATGTYSDGSTRDLTPTATWTSATTTVATVDAGELTGVAAGTSVVTATKDGVSATVTATVTTATLTALYVGSKDSFIAKGATEQFTATGLFSDATMQDLTKQATWSSSGPAVTFGGAPGLGTGVEVGSVTITATFMGISGSLPFQVTDATLTAVAVTPWSPSIAKGTKLAFVATGILSDHTIIDLTKTAHWSSSAEAVAKFDATSPKGVATAVDVGTATITADQGGVSGTTMLTVTAAELTKIDLVPLNPTLAKGASMNVVAIGTFTDGTAQDLTEYATWGSSNTSVATVSNDTRKHGLVTAIDVGTTTISASVGTKSGSTIVTVSQATLTAISVTPTDPSIAKGTSIKLTATAIYSDDTTLDVTWIAEWSSADTSKVKFANVMFDRSIATGVAVGETTVKATLGNVYGTTTVTVTSATLDSIAIWPHNPAIAKGTSVQLSATGTYSDGSTQDLTYFATWTSSDASVSVSNEASTRGEAFGMVVGSATVTATIPNGPSGSTVVTVTDATLQSVAIAPEDPSIPKGTVVLLKLTGTYSDNSKQDLTDSATWSSSATDVVSVYTGAASTYPRYPGLATAEKVGAATITATFVGGGVTKTDSVVVTVTPATLVSLTIDPVNPTIAKGTAIAFKVTGRYTDGTDSVLTTQATWSSSDTTKAIISNAAGSNGLATAVAVGTTTISATFGGVSTSTRLTVSAATLTSITVTPTNPSVAQNSTRQFTATGTFSDDTTLDLTAWVTWSSSDETKAIVSNAFGSKGLATGVAPGTSTIKATIGAISGSTTLTVTSP